MPYTPLYPGQPLPQIGVQHEDLNFELKGEIKSMKDGQIAKYIAAFANAAGGTILVGATEASGVLSGWLPMTAQAAQSTRDRCSKIANEKCSPIPVVDPQILEHSSGNFVVAINVPPYTVLPVGVRVTTNDALEGKAWEAWIIWVRVGVDSKRFTPEQAAMLMIPDVRRILTLLSAIPSSERKAIRTYYHMPQMTPVSEQTKKTFLDLEEIKPLANVAVFQVSDFQRAGFSKLGGSGPVHIPLDQISSVWSVPGGWGMSLKGQLQVLHDERAYVPNY